MLVLFADVVFFREVDEVDYRFGGEEEEGVDELDLYILSVFCLMTR